jgi:hypothetical protein
VDEELGPHTGTRTTWPAGSHLDSDVRAVAPRIERLFAALGVADAAVRAQIVQRVQRRLQMHVERERSDAPALGELAISESFALMDDWIGRAVPAAPGSPQDLLPLRLAMLNGAAGGAGGLVTSIAELPVTVTVMLHAIRRVAEEEGFDPDDPAIRAEVLRVFAAGSPLAKDDGVNTAFLGARVALTGPALQRLLAATAPRLAAVLGQKLLAQSVPLLGAVAGAGLNAAFIGYYREVAHVRFGLLRLAEVHGPGPVLAAFAKAAAPPRVTRV